jgi:ankyrin repeat protein
MLAAELDHSEIDSVLLAAGSNPQIKCNTGKSALIYAAISGSTEIENLLIISGANLD